MEEVEIDFKMGQDEDIGTADPNLEAQILAAGGDLGAGADELVGAKGPRVQPPSPQQPQQAPQSVQTAVSQAPVADEPPKAAEEPEEPKDVIEILEPKAEVMKWTFGPESAPMVYYQRPLNFLSKMQWFALVGDMLDKALAGDDALSINNIMEMPGADRDGDLSLEDFKDADMFVRAVGKLIVYAPKFLEDSFILWLNVPKDEERLVRDMMNEPAENGGLGDDMGMEMIEIFIDQNWDALTDFFGGRVAKIRKRVVSQRELRRRRQGPRR